MIFALVLIVFGAFLNLICAASKVKIEEEASTSEMRELLEKSLALFPEISEALFLERGHDSSSTFEEVCRQVFLEPVVWAHGMNVNPITRFNHLFKPVDLDLLKISKFSVFTSIVSSVDSEDSLKPVDFEKNYQKLKSAGLFVRESKKDGKKTKLVIPGTILKDTNLKALLKHFYCRRALALSAPGFETADVGWLQEVDSSALALNHGLLDRLEDFFAFKPQTVLMAAEKGYDFCANSKAMKTMSPTALAAILEARKYCLSFEEFVAIFEAKNFKTMLETDAFAWQCFSSTPAYFETVKGPEQAYAKVKPLLKDRNALGVLLSLYLQTEARINSALFTIGNGCRFGLANDQMLGISVISLKQSFALRSTIIADFKEAGMLHLAALFETSTFSLVRAALNEFDGSCHLAEDQIVAKIKESILQQITDPLQDQIHDYRVILQCFERLPYTVNKAHSYVELLQLVINATKVGSAQHLSKVLVCNLAFNAAIIGEASQPFSDLLLGALSSLPVQVFTEDDSKMLKTNYGEAKGFSGLIEAIEKQLQNLFGPTFLVQEFLDRLKVLLSLRGRLVDDLDSLKKLAEVDAMLECAVGRACKALKGEKWIVALREYPLLVEAIKAVPQALDRQSIRVLLSNSIIFLRNNQDILHGLCTYEDFKIENLLVLHDCFEVENIQVGLPTVPAKLLFKMLVEKCFSLNKPADFIWRLNPSIWSLCNFQPLFISSLNMATVAWSPIMADSENFASQAEVFADAISAQSNPVSVLKLVLTWFIMNEMRFLECFTFLKAILASSDKSRQAEYKRPKQLLMTTFLQFSILEAYEMGKAVGLVERFSDDEHVGALAKKLLNTLQQPLSQVRARVIAQAIQITASKEAVLKLLASSIPLKELFPNFASNLKSLFKTSNDTNLFSYLNRKISFDRRECLQLVQQLFTGKDMSLMESRLEVFAIMEADLTTFNNDAVVNLSTGILPLWEKKVAARFTLN